MRNAVSSRAPAARLALLVEIGATVVMSALYTAEIEHSARRRTHPVMLKLLTEAVRHPILTNPILTLELTTRVSHQGAPFAR